MNKIRLWLDCLIEGVLTHLSYMAGFAVFALPFGMSNRPNLQLIWAGSILYLVFFWITYAIAHKGESK